MIPSPIDGAGALVEISIEVDGKAIDSAYQVESIDTWTSFNKVPRATIVLFDGSPAAGDFPISDAKTFLPGAKVTLSAGYNERKKSKIFSGVIVKHGIEISGKAGSRLTLDLADPAIKMTLARKNAAFPAIKDSALIGKLCKASGLDADVAGTTTEHERIVQFYATDWDLMLTRAEANGLVVVVSGGKVTVKAPDTEQAAVLRVTYGESILDLQAEMDATDQLAASAIKSYAWDASTQALVDAGPGAVSVTEAGNVTSAALAKVFGVDAAPQQSGAPLAKASLADWSAARLRRVKLAKIRGHVRFLGSALAEVGKTLELSGLGDRFDGVVLIGGVHHGIQHGSWITTVTFGLSPRPFAAEAPRIAAPDASGQIPPVKGLQTGIVKKVAKDEAGEFRVLVTLPLLREKEGVWARPGAFYASNGFGAVFYPEVGDEVVVGFMNEDPRYPVILGALYSKKRPPPGAARPDEKNNKKAIVSRSKLTITFDDTNEKKPTIEIRTPGNRSFKLDDAAGVITLTDGKNKVALSSNGILLHSASDLKIEAKGDIALDAGGKLTLSAKADASMAGLNVKHEAKAQFSAKANGAAELKAPSGIVTVQGSMVKIN